jgi:hypothetical protein
LERALAAMLEATTGGTRPQPNSGAPRGDEVVQSESGSAGKGPKRPKNEHECLESENEQRENAHGRNAPDDQGDDNGCI